VLRSERLRATALDPIKGQVTRFDGASRRARLSRWPVSMTPRGPASRSLLIALGFLVAAVAAGIARTFKDYFDSPAALVINHHAPGDGIFNQIIANATYPTVQGIVIVSLAWCCWFSNPSPEMRARLIRGAAAAILAAYVTRILHDRMPFSPRPIFEPSLDIHLRGVLGDMDTLRATSNPTSPSFPSERATLFAALAIAILMVSRRIGWLALGCTTAIEICRVYLGFHYPSDIIASVCLAAAFVWFADAGAGLGPGSLLVKWNHASVLSFYAFGCFISYEIVTAFADLRYFAGFLPF
jgi:membrane-associated phospholipid phosphatase